MKQGPADYITYLQKKQVVTVVRASEEEVKRLRDQLNIPIGTASDEARKSYPHTIYESVVSALPLQERTMVNNNVAFGELLISDVNASLRKSGDGYSGFVIILNRGLADLFYHTTKVIVSLSGTEEHLSRAHGAATIQPLIQYDDGVQAISFLLKQYRNGGSPHLPFGRLPVDLPHAGLWSNLQHWAICFVIAHELGHFLAGHLSQPLSIEHEYEADAIAMSLVLNIANQTGQDMEIRVAITGCMLTLNYVEMLETAFPSPILSHPPARRRIERITEVFGYDKSYYEMADALDKMAKLLADSAVALMRK